MKVGSASSSASIGYTSGSIYKRHGINSVQKQGNLQRMNREALENYIAAFSGGSAGIFDMVSAASQSRSEQIAENLLQKLQAAAKASSSSSTNLGSLLNTSA
jgi:hypothetical protein